MNRRGFLVAILGLPAVKLAADDYIYFANGEGGVADLPYGDCPTHGPRCDGSLKVDHWPEGHMLVGNWPVHVKWRQGDA